jgi:ketosteroid isomerase-like protein
MTKTKKEIAVLAERLRQAELGPDPETFEDLLADNVVLVDQSGTPALAKQKVVEAHRAGKGPKFTRVEMSDVQVTEQGSVAIVTCTGRFEGPQWSGTLKFMRVWLRKNGRWQVVAGSIHH